MPDEQISRRPAADDETVRPPVDAPEPAVTDAPDPTAEVPGTAARQGGEDEASAGEHPVADHVAPRSEETPVRPEPAPVEESDGTGTEDVPPAQPAPEAQVAPADEAAPVTTSEAAGTVAETPGSTRPPAQESDQPTAVRPAVTEDRTSSSSAPAEQEAPAVPEVPEGGGATGEEPPVADLPPVLPVPPELRPRPVETTAADVGTGAGQAVEDVASTPAAAVLQPSATPEGQTSTASGATPVQDVPATDAGRSRDETSPSSSAGDTGSDAPAVPTHPVEAGRAGSPAEPEPPGRARDAAEEADAAGGPAAATASDEPEVPVRRVRTLRDWLRPDLRQTVIAILLAAFAFAVVTQIRARDQADSYSTLRQSDLVAMLDGLNQESERLKSELDSLHQAQTELESGKDSEELARAQAEQRLTSLGILAGTPPAQGPGITMTISDPQHNVKPGMLLDAIEEMRDAGAEAIQVNGSIRVVADSWVASGPSGIIIDGRAVSTPITFDVIGDPHSLEEAARFRGGLVSQITDSRVGGQVSIVRSDDLVISALHQQQAPRYARPDRSAAGAAPTPTD